MKNFFEINVKYRAISESGREVVNSENYLVEADSYSDAEAQINERLPEYVGAYFEVKKIVGQKVEEVIGADGEKFYKIKLTYTIIDDNIGKMKKARLNYLVQADNLRDAYDRVNDFCFESAIAYEITSIFESKIVHVFSPKNIER